MAKNFVNFIAMTALRDYADDIKTHPGYGWQVRNVAGVRDYNKVRNETYTDLGGFDFAHAVMVAAANKEALQSNDIWVEPNYVYRNEQDHEYCMWILKNNKNVGDYTTLENMAAGRCNVPNGGVSDRTYDVEYRTWIEQFV